MLYRGIEYSVVQGIERHHLKFGGAFRFVKGGCNVFIFGPHLFTRVKEMHPTAGLALRVGWRVPAALTVVSSSSSSASVRHCASTSRSRMAYRSPFRPMQTSPS